MRSLLLTLDDHDLVIDVYANIAVSGNPYSLAQDAGCAIRTFQGECWYDTSLGVPYWTEILGHFPPIGLVKARFAEAALTVPQVSTALVFVTSFKDRVFQGQVQITSVDGKVSTIGFQQISTANLPPGRSFSNSYGPAYF